MSPVDAWLGRRPFLHHAPSATATPATFATRVTQSVADVADVACVAGRNRESQKTSEAAIAVPPGGIKPPLKLRDGRLRWCISAGPKGSQPISPAIRELIERVRRCRVILVADNRTLVVVAHQRWHARDLLALAAGAAAVVDSLHDESDRRMGITPESAACDEPLLARVRHIDPPAAVAGVTTRSSGDAA